MEFSSLDMTPEPPPLCSCLSTEFLKRHSFLIGASFAVVASLLDLVTTWKEQNGGSIDDDDDDDATSGGENPLSSWNIYKVLMTVATVLYWLDSILHINSQSATQEEEISDGHSNGEGSDEGYVTRQAEKAENIRFATIFGVAAMFDLGSSILDDEENPRPAFVSECLSVYIFWMSAHFMLYTKRKSYRQGFSFLLLGDVLFWMGCTTDVFVSVLDRPTNNVSSLGIAFGGVISSILWFADAILYELAGADIFEMEVKLGNELVATLLPEEDDENVPTNAQ